MPGDRSEPPADRRPTGAAGEARRGTAVRFALAGLANTAFGFMVYSLCIVAGLPVPAALLLGNLLGMVFNFITLGGYAFRDLSRANLPRFILAYVGLLAINWLCIRGLTAVSHIGVILAQAVLMLPLALLSYLVMSRGVFNRSRATR
jgi:putative flippase GtrA